MDNSTKIYGTPSPMTDQEALEWLVEFARLNLEHLQRPGDMTNLTWDMARFLGEEPWNEFLTWEDIQTVHPTIKEFLEAMSVEGGCYNFPNFDKAKSRFVCKQAARRGGQVKVTYAGRIESIALAHAMDRMVRSGVERLGRCKRCEQIFLGQRGRLYCRRECANATAAAAYRKRKADHLKQKARATYKTKQQAKLGPKVKVGRKGD